MMFRNLFRIQVLEVMLNGTIAKNNDLFILAIRSCAFPDQSVVNLFSKETKKVKKDHCYSFSYQGPIERQKGPF